MDCLCVCVCVCVCENKLLDSDILSSFFLISPSNLDVQPFAALGKGLQDYKDENGIAVFEVLGMTNVNDGVSIFNSLGVKAEGVHFDMADFIRNNAGMRKAMETGSAIQFGTIISNEFCKKFPNEFIQQWNVAKEYKPDLIISCTITILQASAIGQALRVPVIHGDLYVRACQQAASCVSGYVNPHFSQVYLLLTQSLSCSIYTSSFIFFYKTAECIVFYRLVDKHKQNYMNRLGSTNLLHSFV
jgi:hypothetical protein